MIHSFSKRRAALSSTLHKAAAVGFSATAFLTFAISAQANLVSNGNFTSCGTSAECTTGGQIGDEVSLTGWTVSSTNYAFLFPSASVAASGVPGSDGTIELWSTSNGGSNALANPPGSTTNFVGADGIFQVPSPPPELYQTINGLTSGDSYTVSFYYAAAQQESFSGATSSGWDVSFGSQTDATALLSNPSDGSTPWQLASFTFTATSTSEVLGFTPVGEPTAGGGSGEPPFSLLDGVDLEMTPEPGYLGVGFGMMALMVGMGVIRSKKRAKA